MLVKSLGCSLQTLLKNIFSLAFSMEYFEISIVLIFPVNCKLLQTGILIAFRGSRSQIFFKKDFLLVLEFLFNNVTGLKAPTQVFSCEYCEMFKNSFFIEHLQWLLFSIVTRNEKIVWKHGPST